jgi:hypothetical protein
MPNQDSTSLRWTATRRGRRELLVIALFCLSVLVVPLFRTELYPFSRAPMFADAPRVYCSYTVLDPDGARLPLDEFGLQRNYWGNPPGVGVGFAPPASVDRFGTVASQEEVIAAVGSALASRTEIPYVDVIQEVTEPIGTRVGRGRTSRWRVINPASLGNGGR